MQYYLFNEDLVDRVDATLKEWVIGSNRRRVSQSRAYPSLAGSHNRLKTGH